MKHLKLFENFNDDEVLYSVVNVDTNYRIFAQTPVMRKKGLSPEDCELLFGKGTMWKNYLTWEEAQKAIDSLQTNEEEFGEDLDLVGESVNEEFKMRKVKSYEGFVNEEISLGNILRTGALATSLALSQPSQAINNQPVQTEISTEQQSVDWEDIVECPGQSKSDIHKKVSQKLRMITGLRIVSSSPDKLICTLNMKSKPKNSNGQTLARVEVEISEGQYTIKFVDVKFIYVGSQPTDPLYNTGQNIKSKVGDEVSRTVVRGSGNSILGNMAGSMINQATRPQPKQYKNFTYDEGDSYYKSQVNTEIVSIVSLLKF